MVINIIGDCDKRPVLFTVMKLCQTLGDVLVVTSSSRLVRLSDTGESYGHCQNTMIVYTQDGIDSFWEDFEYNRDSFNYIIVDNIVDAEADMVIYVRGMAQTESEKDLLEYIDKYHEIMLYNGKFTDNLTLKRCEEFEALHDFCPINSHVAAWVAEKFAPVLNTKAEKLYKIAMASSSVYLKTVPPIKTKTHRKAGLFK